MIILLLLLSNINIYISIMIVLLIILILNTNDQYLVCIVSTGVLTTKVSSYAECKGSQCKPCNKEAIGLRVGGVN